MTDRDNAMRLAGALMDNAGSQTVKTLARLLGYNESQLEQDIQSLWRVMVTVKPTDE